MQDAEESQPPNRNRWPLTLFIVSFALALGTGGISLVYPFLPLYIQTLRDAHFISPELLAGLVIGAPPLVASLAMPFWGRLADQYGRKKMVMRALFGAAVVLLLMGFAETALALVALRALQGLTSGIIASSMALVAGETPRERIGFALGTLQVGLFGGAAVGPLVGGLLAERFGFQLPFLFTSTMLVLAGALVTVAVRETYAPAADKRLDLNPVNMARAWRSILRTRGVKTSLLAALPERFRPALGHADRAALCRRPDPKRARGRRQRLRGLGADGVLDCDYRRLIYLRLAGGQVGLPQRLDP